MVSLGFDASTSTCGYAFTENGKILCANVIDISKFETSKTKANEIIKKVNSHNINFDSINLEEALSGFGFGRTSQQTLIKLLRWNAVFEYILGETYDKPVNLVGAMTARKQLFGKARIKGVDSKTFVNQELRKLFDLTPFEIYNRNNVLDKKNEDIRDAIVISFYKLLKGKNTI
jgi:hypothetical protein